MILVDIIAFYGFQFDDYWTTILGLKRGAQELNPFASPFASSPLLLALYKLGLGTFALVLTLIMMQLSAFFKYILFADILGEAVIAFLVTFVSVVLTLKIVLEDLILEDLETSSFAEGKRE